MSTGYSAFKRIQVGREVTANKLTPGVQAAATQFYYGTLQLTPEQGFYEPDEERASIAMLHRATPVSRGSMWKLEGSAQFETLPILFGMSFQGNVASALVPAASPRLIATKAKRWIYAPNMAESNTPDTYTFEYGDNYRAYIGTHVLCKNLELRYEMNNAVMISADLFGKFNTDGDALGDDGIFTTGLKQTRTHDLVSQQTDIYVLNPTAGAFDTSTEILADFVKQIDTVRNAGYTAAPSAPGAIELGSAVNALTITIPTGFDETRYMTGELDLSSYSQARRSFDLDFTFRHSPKGNREYQQYKKGGVEGSRIMTVITSGPEIEKLGTSAGSDETTFNYECGFHFACIYIESPQFFTDLNGDNGFSMKAKSIHDAAWNRDIYAYVIN